MKQLLIFILLILCCSSAFSANHSFTGLPINAVGWTDFDALTSSGYGSSRVVFVSSSSGNDTDAANNITSNGHYSVSDLSFDADGFPQAPGGVEAFSTIATAYAYCRDGDPDILLLERGSSWSAGLGVGVEVKSGSSQTTPHIIASYGSSGDRPILTDVELDSYNASYLIISGIKLYSADWTTATTRGIDSRGTGSYRTFEDLYIDGKNGDIVDESVSNIAFRRCVWTHGEAHDGQLYAHNVTDLLLEECIFHEPYDDTYTDESQFGRHLYFAAGDCGEDCMTGVVIRGNIFFSAERGGGDIRSGGRIYANLWVRASLGVGDAGSGVRQYTSSQVYSNVHLEGTVNTGGGSGISIINNNNTRVYDNILTDPTNITLSSTAISIAGNSTNSDYRATDYYIYDNIVYNRAGTGTNRCVSSVGINPISNINIYDNDFQMGTGSDDLIFIENSDLNEFTFTGNRYYTTAVESVWFDPYGSYASWISNMGETGSSNSQVTYTAPTRTVKTYNQTIGGSASTDEFMTAAIGQSRQNWDSRYLALTVVNYIREGFDKSPVSYAGSKSLGLSGGSGAISFDGSKEIRLGD